MSRKYKRLCMGMKYLKMYEDFKEGDIREICENYDITNYKINDDFSVDVDGSVDLSNIKLYRLPLKFGKVTGSFNCEVNYLTSLERSPTYVGGSFKCNANKLTSLDGCPLEIKGYFDASHNKLENLKGLNSVGTDIYCNNNNLTSLEGCPERIYGDFNFSMNKVSTLEGCAKEVGGNFKCSYNKLETLKYGPREVGGNFSCDDNKLTTLEGSPSKVLNFSCSRNLLTNLVGLPDRINGGLYCQKNNITSLIGYVDNTKFVWFGNKVQVIAELFPEEEQFISSLDYNYFLGGNEISKFRLTQALKEYGLKCPGNIIHYTLV